LTLKQNDPALVLIVSAEKKVGDDVHTRRRLVTGDGEVETRATARASPRCRFGHIQLRQELLGFRRAILKHPLNETPFRDGQGTVITANV